MSGVVYRCSTCDSVYCRCVQRAGSNPTSKQARMFSLPLPTKRPANEVTPREDIVAPPKKDDAGILLKEKMPSKSGETPVVTVIDG